MTTRPSALLDLLLTRDPKQRVRLTQAALASVLLMLAIVLMHVLVWLGINAGAGLWVWTAMCAGGIVTMFLAIRLGWSARFADPALTAPQMLYAVACAAGAYRIAGAGQGVALMMLGIILMFGMFGLDRRQAWLIGAYSISAFGLAMFSGAIAEPAVYDARVQLAYFTSLILFVGGLLAVSGRVGALRRRLRSQRTELANALEHISVIATHDALTGLLNRRAMTELLETERERSVRAGHQWSVAILDVDQFKLANDLHGHAAGDEALRVVASACTSIVRKCDSVSRWGG